MLYKIAFSRVKGNNPQMAAKIIEMLGSEKEYFTLTANSAMRFSVRPRPSCRLSPTTAYAPSITPTKTIPAGCLSATMPR